MKKIEIVFRVDSSLVIGTGHIMRCLTLADEFARRGAKCHFICREHEGNLLEFIAQKGYITHKLPLKAYPYGNTNACELFHGDWLGASQEEDALQTTKIIDSIKPEWLIIDHYALDINWEQKLKAYCQSILVIDDLADRHHDCDILVDQTYRRRESEYLDLTPPDCQILCGSKYALLRPEFQNWREYSLKRRQSSELKHLLITLGGVDKDNITSDILDSLKQAPLPKSLKITVVMGSTAPWIETVKRKATELPWCTEVKSGVSNMAELMANSDLAIGAAGATTWERCCLGLPTLMLVIAENQIKAANTLEEANVVIKMNNAKNISVAIKEVINNPFLIRVMSESCKNITDGKGCKRVFKNLTDLNTYNRDI